VFDRLAEEALEAYDRIIGLDLSECSIDGRQHKAHRRPRHRSQPH
jgi:hypothetical protein